jgi:hypothetical protein
MKIETCVTHDKRQTDIIITSCGCWANKEPPPEPTAHTDPEPLGYSLGGANKETTQKRLPASCFSGILHTWVQALYGNPLAHYAEVIAQRSGGSDNTVADYMVSVLAVPAYNSEGVLSQIKHLAFQHSADTGFTPLYNEGTSGVIRLGGAYVLVEVGTSTVYFYRIVFSPCAKRALRTADRYAVGSAERDALLAYAFASAYPERDAAASVAVSNLSAWGTQFGPYGWKFNGSGSEASAILVVAQNYGDPPPLNGVHCIFRHARLTFAGTITDPQVILTAVETSDPLSLATPIWSNLVGYYAPVCWVEGGPWFSTATAGTYNTIFINRSDPIIPVRYDPATEYDVPVYCWYVGDTLRVIRYRLAFGDVLNAETNTGDCYVNYTQRTTMGCQFYFAGSPGTDAVSTCDYDVLDGAQSTKVEVQIDGFYDRASPLLNLDLDVSEFDFDIPILHIPYGSSTAALFVRQRVTGQVAETRTIPDGTIGWQYWVWNEALTVQLSYGGGTPLTIATREGSSQTGPTGSEPVPCFNEMAAAYVSGAPLRDWNFLSSSTNWYPAGEARLRYRVKTSRRGAAVYIHDVFDQTTDENNPPDSDVTATDGYGNVWRNSSFIGWA